MHSRRRIPLATSKPEAHLNTKLHFDVAHRNCPEYDNVIGLKGLLRRRLEAITNKKVRREAGFATVRRPEDPRQTRLRDA